MTHTCKTPLYPYQRDAISRIQGFGGRCLLALGMGCGKSLISISYIMESQSFPAVIICPASLKYNWENEFDKHYGKSVRVLSGTKPESEPPLTNSGETVYVANYDILHAWVPSILKINPSIVVLDESQYVKSPVARRTKACAYLCYQAPQALFLSGTPMQNNPMELYPQLNMIFRGHIVSKHQFMNRYTNWFRGKFNNIIIKGSRNEHELNTFLNSRCMIRYRTEDVVPDLPDFVRQTTLLEMTPSQKKEYALLEEEFLRWLMERYPNKRIPRSDMSAILTQCGYMKRQVAEWKIPAMIEQIYNFLEGDEGKLIVFGLHRKVLDAIWDEFSKKNNRKHPFIVRIQGDTPAEDRASAVSHFQDNGNTRLFLGQLVAAGVGLTLTASNHTMFTELDYNPANHTQAEARNRRIGSKANFVHYNYLVMKDTIEEKVCNALFQKQRSIDAVVDGKEDQFGSSFALIDSVISEGFSIK